MVITQQQIRRAVPEVYGKRLDAFVAAWNQWAEPFEINSPMRIVHALAQLLHESGNLRYVEENLNYSADGLLRTFPKYFNQESAKQYARQPERIANRVYANRMGNGNESSGDGWKYRGRGFIQTTGRNAYRDYSDSEFCVGDALGNPDMLLSFPDDLKSALFYWWKNGCNELADEDDARAITKRINGGFNGLSNRLFLLRRLKREFGIQKF